MTPNLAIICIQNQVDVQTNRSSHDQSFARRAGNRESSAGWSFWGFPIVVPIVLLWIPAVLLAPLVLIILGTVCIAADVSFTRTVATFWNLVCSLRGTDVRVCADGKRITVRIL
jgi:hypothetical protein